MVGEFHCSGEMISGYQRLRNPYPIGETELELFHQSIAATGATRLALYLTYRYVDTANSIDARQRAVSHFEMFDGDSYQFHINFSTEPSPGAEVQTEFIGVRGKRSLNVAHVRSTGGTGGLNTQSPMLYAGQICLNFNDNSALDASNCSSFQVTEPSPPLIGPEPTSFSDNWVAKMMTLSPF